MTTREARGHFNRATIAWLTRNGVTACCHGPSHTWHDDPSVTQAVCAPAGVECGAWCYDEERESFAEQKPGAVEMPPKQFAEFCRRAGAEYVREVS